MIERTRLNVTLYVHCRLVSFKRRSIEIRAFGEGGRRILDCRIQVSIELCVLLQYEHFFDDHACEELWFHACAKRIDFEFKTSNKGRKKIRCNSFVTLSGDGTHADGKSVV